MEERVSRFAAEDGFSVHAITQSTQIREFLKSKNYSLPKNPSGTMMLIKKYHTEIIDRKKHEVEVALQNNKRFAITLDEYTGLNEKRYLNVNLHYEDKLINLGLSRMIGSHDTYQTLNLLEQRLDLFGVSLKSHVVAMTTDGASIMKKLGMLSRSQSQLCFAHGINLCFQDVVYNKLIVQNVEDSEDEESENESVPHFAQSFIQPIIKARKMIKLFRKSPVKNDVLMKYSRAEFQKELHLILDVKTRWNSMLLMIQRYLKMRKSISFALIDLNIRDTVTDEDCSILRELAEALEPLRLGSEKICRKDATLLTAEVTFTFILNELNRQNNSVSRLLEKQFKLRYQQRKNNTLVALLKYLQNPSSIMNHQTSKSECIQLAESLHERLFSSNQHNFSYEDGNESESPEKEMAMAERLKHALDKGNKEQPKKLQCGIPLVSYMKREFIYYENSCERTTVLENLYCALKNIKPSSVDSERAFSITSMFLTKFRCRLSDDSIDALTFLRQHFIEEKYDKCSLT